VKAVNVPVIACGGIADAKGVACRDGARCQRRADRHGVPALSGGGYQRRASAALQSDYVAHTALTNVFSGRPARGIVNRVMRELGADERHGTRVSIGGERLSRRCALAPKAKGSGDFLAPLERPKRERVPRSFGCGNHAGIGGRPVKLHTWQVFPFRSGQDEKL